MEFDRVRTPEQRIIRINQIKAAALKLFDTTQYHEITLALIASETNYTRGNLYKYIASKEEIFLLILLDEIHEWIDDLNTNLVRTDSSSFPKEWATIVYRHPRLLKLMSLLGTILERNVSLEKLVAFKNEWAGEIGRLLVLLSEVFPHWSDSTRNRFLTLQNNYASGLFPLVSPTSLQLEALKQSQYQYQIPDFIADYSEFIQYTLVYLDTLS